MTAALIVGYVVIAVVAFVAALYAFRDELRDSADDRVGAALASFAFVVLAASWPMTAAVFLAAGVCGLVVQAIVRVLP